MSEKTPQYNHKSFYFNEEYLSQIPAIQLLINLGYQYIPPEQTVKERNGKLSGVLLDNILRDQLKVVNKINYKGSEYLFSEENIQTAIQKLKSIKYDGLLKTNENIYDLLTLGVALEQTIEGDSKSFNLKYIDWHNPDRNCFHVTAEYSVERSRSSETIRPDIVLFVNGIPLSLIECKSPKTPVEKAVSQMIRNQNDDYIPALFIFTQLVLGINKNGATYATTGSASKFWSIWKENPKSKLVDIVNKPLSTSEKFILFSGVFKSARSYFDNLESDGKREITGQDKTLFSLCQPERILELAFKFTVFDFGIKKIARYQQYFVIKSTLDRIKKLDSNGRRKGGIVWHTQGSGKSLTMVMLARTLAFETFVKNPRIVLVTDRTDLDKQLSNTFAACGLEPSRATSGKHLLELVSEHKAGIVTTLIHKFDKALNIKKYKDYSPDIFMLIDESHRTNFGSFSARMRQMFPNACYLGFTGTPLLKKEKNNFVKFGGLINPHYSITQAVEDGAIVPLLYEGRHVEMTLDEIGYVSSEVIMSPPDSREGYEETEDEPTDAVVKFWQKMMKRYGNEGDYNKQIINQFKNGAEPEMLIVIDKLLTGFDAPRNVVLYLCRILREHTLLQAIARVNRLYEHKEYGYIVDYASILGELDKALTMYSAFEGFDEDTYEKLLADDAIREEFYLCLTDYSKTLLIALSTESFIMNTNEDKINVYKVDLKRFQNLKTSVKLRYAESILYRDYEPKIKKLLDTHIQANEVLQLNEPVNIFDEKSFNKVKEERGVYSCKSAGSRADTIAHAIKKVITEKMEEDPAFYQKFSILIQQAIDDFRAKRMSDLDYLNKVSEIRNKVVNKQHDDMPEKINRNDGAMAYYGIVKPFFEANQIDKILCEDISVDTAIAIQEILKRHSKVHFWDDDDAQNKVKNDIDDFLYEEIKEKRGIELTIAQMDEIIMTTMKTAKYRSDK